ncbi:MAG: aspartate-semialdehyde dehydrogenase, partial [Clostridia bacterium]|nr:aspartate-semialdehyde dehydrogenase [Clostridia bacterium]
IQYFDEPDRPQTKLDRDFERGTGISLGRLRGDTLFDWRFVGLSHNTLRGAAGGGVLSAEYLCHEGYIPYK